MWLREEEMASLDYDELYRAILRVESTNLGRIFDFAKKVLCVQPHPDDTDFAAGGLIAKLTKRGCEVAYVTLTDGRIGTLDPSLYPEKLASVRVEEQKEAAEILGVKKLMWLNYRDSELRVTIEARNKLVTLIREFQPDLILTVDPWLTYEAHPDHVATGILAVEAAFFAMFPHANPGDVRGGLRPHPTAFIAFYWTRKPNVYVDITDYMGAKLKAASSHKSQHPPGGFEEVENLLKTYSILMGKKIGVQYAEAFKVLSPLKHLHCCVYAEDL